MKHLTGVALLSLLLASAVYAACEDETTEQKEETGEVKQFFKKLGCSIQKGATKVSESTKPWVDEIEKGAIRFGENAKKFGSDVIDKFSDLKEKLTSTEETTNTTVAAVTEGEGSTASPAITDAKTKSDEPSSFDDRFLFETEQKCLKDHKGNCRPKA